MESDSENGCEKLKKKKKSRILKKKQKKKKNILTDFVTVLSQIVPTK